MLIKRAPPSSINGFWELLEGIGFYGISCFALIGKLELL
jgi:hypothetical protein